MFWVFCSDLIRPPKYLHLNYLLSNLEFFCRGLTCLSSLCNFYLFSYLQTFKNVPNTFQVKRMKWDEKRMSILTFSSFSHHKIHSVYAGKWKSKTLEDELHYLSVKQIIIMYFEVIRILPAQNKHYLFQTSHAPFHLLMLYGRNKAKIQCSIVLALT